MRLFVLRKRRQNFVNETSCEIQPEKLSDKKNSKFSQCQIKEHLIISLERSEIFLTK